MERGFNGEKGQKAEMGLSEMANLLSQDQIQTLGWRTGRRKVGSPIILPAKREKEEEH